MEKTELEDIVLQLSSDIGKINNSFNSFRSEAKKNDDDLFSITKDVFSTIKSNKQNVTELEKDIDDIKSVQRLIQNSNRELKDNTDLLKLDISEVKSKQQLIEQNISRVNTSFESFKNTLNYRLNSLYTSLENKILSETRRQQLTTPGVDRTYEFAPDGERRQEQRRDEPSDRQRETPKQTQQQPINVAAPDARASTAESAKDAANKLAQAAGVVGAGAVLSQPSAATAPEPAAPASTPTPFPNAAASAPTVTGPGISPPSGVTTGQVPSFGVPSPSQNVPVAGDDVAKVPNLARVNGGVDRSKFYSELQNPEVRRLFYQMMHAEVGSQGRESQVAFAETVFNRAHATNRSIRSILSDTRYYQPYRDGGFARAGGALSSNPVLSEQYASVLSEVSSGSDTTGGATHNASGSVASSVNRGGFNSVISSIKVIGGETYYSKTFEQGALKQLPRIQGSQAEANKQTQQPPVSREVSTTPSVPTFENPNQIPGGGRGTQPFERVLTHISGWTPGSRNVDTGRPVTSTSEELELIKQGRYAKPGVSTAYGYHTAVASSFVNMKTGEKIDETTYNKLSNAEKSNFREQAEIHKVRDPSTRPWQAGDLNATSYGLVTVGKVSEAKIEATKQHLAEMYASGQISKEAIAKTFGHGELQKHGGRGTMQPGGEGAPLAGPIRSQVDSIIARGEQIKAQRQQGTGPAIDKKPEVPGQPRQPGQPGQPGQQGQFAKVNEMGLPIPDVGEGRFNRISGDPRQYADNITRINTPFGSARVSKDAAEAYTGFFNDLNAAGAPISKLGSYNIRPKNSAGPGHSPGSGWSQHSYGNAVDIDDATRLSPAFQRWRKENPGKFEELKSKWGMKVPRGDEPHMEFGGRISQQAYDEIQKRLGYGPQQDKPPGSPPIDVGKPPLDSGKTPQLPTAPTPNQQAPAQPSAPPTPNVKSPEQPSVAPTPNQQAPAQPSTPPTPSPEASNKDGVVKQPPVPNVAEAIKPPQEKNQPTPQQPQVAEAPNPRTNSSSDMYERRHAQSSYPQNSMGSAGASINPLAQTPGSHYSLYGGGIQV